LRGALGRGKAGISVRVQRLLFFVIAGPLVLWSIVSTVGLSGEYSLIFIAAGVRALSPASLIFVMERQSPTLQFRKAMASTVMVVATVACFLGFYQALAYEHSLFYGREGWLTVRVFSVMSIPSTFANFLAVALYFTLFEGGALWRRRYRYSLAFLILVNVFLTASGTGLLASAVVMVGYASKRFRSWRFRLMFILTAALIVPILFSELQMLTGREGVFNSLLIRFDIFANQLGRLSLGSLLFGEGIGVGTNVARVLTITHMPGMTELFSDSTITALLLQFGFVGVALFYVPCIAHLVRLRRKGDTRVWLLGAVLLVSLVTNIFEIFPVNWIFFCVLGMTLRECRDPEPVLS